MVRWNQDISAGGRPGFGEVEDGSGQQLQVRFWTCEVDGFEKGERRAAGRRKGAWTTLMKRSGKKAKTKMRRKRTL